jgi:hypothetical protein
MAPAAQQLNSTFRLRFQLSTRHTPSPITEVGSRGEVEGISELQKEPSSVQFDSTFAPWHVGQTLSHPCDSHGALDEKKMSRDIDHFRVQQIYDYRCESVIG